VRTPNATIAKLIAGETPKYQPGIAWDALRPATTQKRFEHFDLGLPL
jgi:hypothetical protein